MVCMMIKKLKLQVIYVEYAGIMEIKKTFVVQQCIKASLISSLVLVTLSTVVLTSQLKYILEVSIFIQVGDDTNDKLLQCRCNHLTAFGGGFIIAPNPINLDKVFTEFTRLGETGNYLVLVMVCTIFGVYLLVLIWARKADMLDESQASYIFACKLLVLAVSTLLYSWKCCKHSISLIGMLISLLVECFKSLTRTGVVFILSR